jgi:dGTPase
MNWNQLLCVDRLRPTTKQPEESRGEIHRDYGRVVFSTPVRRLQDKAQVFPLETIDAVRTRLTHSLEVSSVARGMAQVATRQLVKDGKITADQAYDIETIAATCGLVHDIGNPPFGHAGETAIQEWFKKKDEKKQPETTKNGFWDFDRTKKQKYRNDFEQFDGNAQTFRLLATLQILSDRTGLNLTFATLSAVLKYTSNSVETKNNDATKKKPGFFSSEEWLVEMIRDKTGTGRSRNPITFLVEASDDVVYSTVDIEDGIKKGVISWDEVRQILNDNKNKFGGKLFKDCVIGAEKRIAEAGIHVKNRDEAISQYFRTLAIVKGQDAIRRTFFNNYESIMEGTYNKELLYDTDVSAEVAEFFKILKEEINYKHVYNAKETLRLELLGRNVIHFLLDTFWQAERSEKSRSFPQKIYHLLSQNYRTVFESPREEELKLPEQYRKILLLTDYVCGMTDTFALNLRRELQHG